MLRKQGIACSLNVKNLDHPDWLGSSILDTSAMEREQMVSLETVEKLKYVIEMLDELWGDAPECRGKFRLAPNPNPDFARVDDFISSWQPISQLNRDRADIINNHIHALRDNVRWSDFALGFEPLLGYGYKYDPRTNTITCHKYRYARELIDRLATEIKGLIDGTSSE